MVSDLSNSFSHMPPDNASPAKASLSKCDPSRIAGSAQRRAPLRAAYSADGTHKQCSCRRCPADLSPCDIQPTNGDSNLKTRKSSSIDVSRALGSVATFTRNENSWVAYGHTTFQQDFPNDCTSRESNGCPNERWFALGDLSMY